MAWRSRRSAPRRSFSMQDWPYSAVRPYDPRNVRNGRSGKGQYIATASKRHRRKRGTASASIRALLRLHVYCCRQLLVASQLARGALYLHEPASRGLLVDDLQYGHHLQARIDGKNLRRLPGQLGSDVVQVLGGAGEVG